MTLGENIVRLRTQRNWSQGDLADALDISRQSVSKWETDASVPELEKLLKLSELFGVTLDALVRGEDAPQSEPAAAEVQNDPSSFVPQTVPARDKSRSIIGTVLLYRRGHCAFVPAAVWQYFLGASFRRAVFHLRCHLPYGEEPCRSLVRLGGLCLR